MLKRQLRRTVIVLGAAVAAIVLFLGGAAVRLTMGPISLGPLAGAIEDSLNDAISGLTVRFDEAVLEWSRQEGRVNLVILGAKVFDADDRIIAQAPKADLDFSAAALFAGRLSLRQFSLIGVQLTGARTADGKVYLGFGSSGNSPDLLETIRNSFSAGGSGAGSLETIAIRDARLAFMDEPSGLFMISPRAGLMLRMQGGRADAALDAAIEVGGVPSTLKLDLAFREDWVPERGTIEVKSLSLPALAANNPKLEPLRPYDLVSDVFADFVLDGGNQLASASFRLSGAGSIDGGPIQETLHIDRYEIEGSYSSDGGRLTFGTVRLLGKEFSGRAHADLAMGWADGAVRSLAGEIGAENLKIVLPDWFGEPLSVASLGIKGRFDRETDTLQWEKLSVAAGPLAGNLSGKLTFAPPQAPALQLNGTLGKISARELLRFWPKRVGQGAFTWIDSNVLDGRLGPAKIAIDLPIGAMDEPLVSDEGLSISFPFEDGTIRYVPGMTPVTKARGTAELLGNTFKASVPEGAVGPIAVTSGDVRLTDIHVRGSPGFITLHAEGNVPDVLALIDEKPLNYPSRFGLDPRVTGGEASADLSFVVPLRRDLTRKEIGISVAVKTTGLSVPLDANLRLEDAAATFDIDRTSLLAQGTGRLSGVPLRFNWTESFGSQTNSTRVDAEGVLDERSRPVFGLTQPDWVKGKMPFKASLFGNQFRFRDVMLEADATQATAEFSPVNLLKMEGEPARVMALARFAEKGAIVVSNLTVTGDDYDLRGELETDSAKQLSKASFSRVKIGTENDFSAEIAARGDGGLEVKLNGARLDARKLVAASTPESGKEARHEMKPQEKAAGLVDPLKIEAELGHVTLSDGFFFSDMRFGVDYARNERIEGFSLDALDPGGAKVTGRFLQQNAEREITVAAANGGAFVKGFTGFSSVRGGSLNARVMLPKGTSASRESAQLNGTVELSNIVLTNQPFLSRLFAAGSLDGPLRLLQGEGIAVTRFSAPFLMRDMQITIREGRMSGPAIGATFEGTVDRATQKIDMTGSLVPVYTLNSVLGSLPVFGELLVSKPGEGIFGLTYAMRGELREPAITVNPLSVLTPGIFRRIFEFATPKGMQAPDVPKPGPNIQ